MSVIKKNIAASFAGNLWQVLIGIAFIPVYIKLIGIESYGLIGFFAMLQGVFGLLDMGLSATLTRELARLSVLPDKDQEMRNLVRTLEVIYWCLAALSGTIVIIAAPFMANHWLKASELSAQTIEQAIRLMGLAMALQWPAAFYSGGLTGMQRLFTLNGINIGISTLRSVGAVLVLFYIAPTVQAFFVWQIMASLSNTVLLAFFLWRCLPQTTNKATFETTRLRSIWRFAVGLSGIAILSTIFTQLDKLILSKLLSLETFAYYTVAAAMAMNLVRLVTPVFTTIYPRFTQLVALDDQAGLTTLYHKASQLISVLILPVALVIAAFSYELLLIWTQSQATAEATHLILSILICGTAIFGLLHVPYALQLANGWTKLPLYTNTVAILFYIPMLVFMTYRFGAIGGAISWLALNIGEMIVPVYFMHRRLLRGQKWRWYWHDSFVPFAACLSVVGTGRMLLGEMESQLAMAFSILLVSLATLAGAVVSTPTTRVWTLNKLQSLLAVRRV